MAFMTDVHELKDGLVIFRRTDVKHRRWYCRIKLPGQDKYKTTSLRTEHIDQAREQAFDEDADIRFRIKHGVPIFNRLFSEVAKEFADFQKERAEAGQISMHRWCVIDSHIRTQLNRYVGSQQITLIGQDRWDRYPIWRQQNGKGRSGGLVSDGTIRGEMDTFRSVMAYAASKRLIREDQVPKGKLPVSKVAREEFTPDEYRALHSYARSWITKARSDYNAWYRTMAYNFMLVMTNTGMRPSEAKNLYWRDVSFRTDKQGRPVVVLAVRGKGKFRSLVAPSTVADYLDRIRQISKATGPGDPVFTTHKGTPSLGLYYDIIVSLLTKSKLLHSSSGSRRSTYCFRHTYATFRLSEGVDVYVLAKQMGTSVKMIEDHYGHITPVKNADRVLMGLEGWEALAEAPAAAPEGVIADGPKGEDKFPDQSSSSPRSKRRARGSGNGRHRGSANDRARVELDPRAVRSSPTG